jgi:glycosyltransferase involved in cell wall biosynthesis
MVAILQPLIPHYREDFFEGINKTHSCDLFTYIDKEENHKNQFSISKLKSKHIWNVQFKQFIFYSFKPFLSRKYDTLVLMWHFGHLTTWLLLITKPIHRKKIILMGQGISVKRYLKEEKKPNSLLKVMASMADVLWIYMEKEQQQWQAIFPKKEIVAFNNTISNVEAILNSNPGIIDLSPDIKAKVIKIKAPLVFIFCARFTTEHRRADLLLEAIENLDSKKFAFIIIGEGAFKPDFLKFSNVYDFGSIYDNNVKEALFMRADIYFQPGWLGLSVVEAFAYGKPVFTFKRSEDILQCVEYSYVVDEYNGFIFENSHDFLDKCRTISHEEIDRLAVNAKTFTMEKLKMTNMVNSVTESL